MSALLEVEGLRVRLPTRERLGTIVDGIDYHVEPGEVFGVAGESGSGKTMSVLALLRLLPPGARRRRAARRSAARDLLRLQRQRRCAPSRGREHRDGLPGPDDVAAPDAHDRAAADRARALPPRARPQRRPTTRAVELLDEVRIPDPEGALHAYPHQFSGGMRQRIAIAIALACRPTLLIADEPTTALDVTVQAGILRLLDRLRREHGLSVILITHDLGVMSSIADRVSIFYAGRDRRVRPDARGAPAPAPPVHARAARRAAAPEAATRRAARGDPGRAADARSARRPAARSTRAARTRSTICRDASARRSCRSAAAAGSPARRPVPP